MQRDRVEGHWGKAPREIYACTEGGVMGVQSKGADGMVFNPYMNYMEFLPAAELAKLEANPSYAAQTHLLSEVVPGEKYEVVISSFYGMPFVRYRLGHQIRFLPPSGAETLPEFEFLGRSDDRLDIAGFTRIDEKTMWQAVRDTGLPIGSEEQTPKTAAGAGMKSLISTLKCNVVLGVTSHKLTEQ